MPDAVNAIVVFSLAIFLITIGARRLRKHRKIIRNGLPAKGFVYEMNGTKPIIRFVAQDDKWITAEHDSGGLFEKGDTLHVVYDAANPKQFLIQNKSTRIVPYILIASGVVAVVLGIIASLHIIPWHT